MGLELLDGVTEEDMKQLKRLTLLVLLLFCNLTGGVYAASSLESLDIQVILNRDGSADIQETRVMDIDEGTEIYIPIANLGGSRIEKFSVSENGKVFENAGSWNSNLSREEKKHRYGIVQQSEGVELCWGIGDYGRHEYVTTYRVTDMVRQLKDGQALYWKFVNDGIEPSPQAMKVTIVRADGVPITADQTKIWAFGYEGRIEFVDGRIVAESNGGFSSSNYTVVLAQFLDQPFEASLLWDKTLGEVEAMAKKGSSYEDGNSGGVEKGFSILEAVVGFIVFSIPLFIAGIIVYAIKSNKGRRKNGARKLKGEYYRTLHTEEEFDDLIKLLSLIGCNEMDWITAFFLKWIRDNRLEPIKEEVGLIFKREQTALAIVKGKETPSAEMSRTEARLWSFVMEAAGGNSILEKGEFSRWAGKNKSEFLQWRKDAVEDSTQILISRGLIDRKEGTFLFLPYVSDTLTQEGKDLKQNLYRFYNYLYEFSLLNEREAVNVKLWDDLMIWAGALGITDRVSKEFAKLYPQYEQETVYRNNTILTAYAFSQSAVTSYSGSSGGGGFSSSGGGGGSFGGGSGGGIR